MKCKMNVTLILQFTYTHIIYAYIDLIQDWMTYFTFHLYNSLKYYNSILFSTCFSAHRIHMYAWVCVQVLVCMCACLRMNEWMCVCVQKEWVWVGKYKMSIWLTERIYMISSCNKDMFHYYLQLLKNTIIPLQWL